MTKKTLALRFLVTFIVLFILIFAVGLLLKVFGLEAYMPLVAGAIAGGVTAALNIILNRKFQELDHV